jgi:two-component system, OmpR family, response regulator VanR
MDIQILVVEDDEHIRNTVKTFLMNAGYSVDTSADGDEALELFYDKRHQLVILDILLPGMDGLELLKEIRQLSDVPVLMVTALGDDVYQLSAFTKEADDYVTKPFSMQILLKRVAALLRRSGVLKKEIYVGNFTLYPESYKADYDGADLHLTPREFEILLLLAQNKGRVVTHESMIVRIWGYDFIGNEGIVHANIKNLRKKLPVHMIKTVKGIGYRLENEA